MRLVTTDVIAMPEKYFAISCCRNRREQWKLRDLEALLMECPEELVLDAADNEARELENVKNILTSSHEIRCTVFNLNDVSENKGVGDFRFKNSVVGRVTEFFNWDGVKGRIE